MGAMSVAYTTINGEIVLEKRNGVPSDYIPDALGSTIALLSGTHQITDSWTYWPNGQVRARTGTNPTPHTFCGTVGYHSDIVDDFTYVRARDLRVSLARWQAVDPLWPDLRPYSYVGSNPTTFPDPSGAGARWIQISGSFGLLYSHAYLQTDSPCGPSGATSFGFWPRPKPPGQPGTNSHRSGQSSVGSGVTSCSAGASSGSTSSSSGVAGSGSVSSSAGSSSGASSSSSGWSSWGLGTQGFIHQNDENNGQGQIFRQSNSSAFEHALCACIQGSLQATPRYCFGRYGCGSWAEQMWSCAGQNAFRFR